MEEIEDFLYGCFLSYRDSLYLERSLDGLLRLKRSLTNNSPIDQRITDYASSCIRTIFPEIKIPGWNEKEFDELLENEKLNQSLSHEDLMEQVERDSELLREQIESGELDIWDDTPQYIAYEEGKEFLETSLNLLEKKIAPACNGEISLIENLTKRIVKSLGKPPKKENIREWKDYQALLVLWDSARMFHEGEPPFKVVFSNIVAQQLGLDPVLESIRTNKIRPLKKNSYEAKKVIAAFSVCTNSECLDPKLIEYAKILFNKIEFKS